MPVLTATAADNVVDVAIIGAGIGGLAVAVALRRAGFNVHVYERARELHEVGGAVIIREPSVKLFERWNVAAPLFAAAVKVAAIETYDAHGVHTGTLSADPTGEGDAYSVHRGDVHRLLLDAVAPDMIHVGMECVRIIEQYGRCIVTFAEGTVVRANIVIGADGIKSVVRRMVSDDDLVFAKLVVLRGIAPASALPHDLTNDRLYLWGKEPRMMTLLPLRSGKQVAMDSIVTRNEPPADLWTSEVPMAQLLEFFAGFDPRLLDLIRAGTVPVRANPVYDRDPIARWSTERITLLGDAAHPMAPRMGQGANTAIADAAALAAALVEYGLNDCAAAFRRYERERIEPTAAMQRASRKNPADLNRRQPVGYARAAWG